jgi:hypothetical protein
MASVLSSILFHPKNSRFPAGKQDEHNLRQMGAGKVLNAITEVKVLQGH